MRFPGPGAYKANDSIWNRDIPVVIKSRHFFFYDEDIQKSKHCISPQTYLPDTKIQQNNRYAKISFGMGGRSPNINTCKKLFFYNN